MVLRRVSCHMGEVYRASLNHPYIATLFVMQTHQSGSGPMHFLIMELVEGDPLADRLRVSTAARST